METTTTTTTLISNNDNQTSPLAPLFTENYWGIFSTIVGFLSPYDALSIANTCKLFRELLAKIVNRKILSTLFVHFRSLFSQWSNANQPRPSLPNNKSYLESLADFLEDHLSFTGGDFEHMEFHDNQERTMSNPWPELFETRTRFEYFLFLGVFTLEEKAVTIQYLPTHPRTSSDPTEKWPKHFIQLFCETSAASVYECTAFRKEDAEIAPSFRYFQRCDGTHPEGDEHNTSYCGGTNRNSVHFFLIGGVNLVCVDSNLTKIVKIFRLSRKPVTGSIVIREVPHAESWLRFRRLIGFIAHPKCKARGALTVGILHAKKVGFIEDYGAILDPRQPNGIRPLWDYVNHPAQLDPNLYQEIAVEDEEEQEEQGSDMDVE